VPATPPDHCPSGLGDFRLGERLLALELVLRLRRLLLRGHLLLHCRCAITSQVIDARRFGRYLVATGSAVRIPAWKTGN
jgi:hypothetical protein